MWSSPVPTAHRREALHFGQGDPAPLVGDAHGFLTRFVVRRSVLLHCRPVGRLRRHIVAAPHPASRLTTATGVNALLWPRRIGSSDGDLAVHACGEVRRPAGYHRWLAGMCFERVQVGGRVGADRDEAHHQVSPWLAEGAVTEGGEALFARRRHEDDLWRSSEQRAQLFLGQRDQLVHGAAFVISQPHRDEWCSSPSDWLLRASWRPPPPRPGGLRSGSRRR